MQRAKMNLARDAESLPPHHGIHDPHSVRVFRFLAPAGTKKGRKLKFLNMQYTLARIYPENLDLSIKKWHVEYKFYNPATHKMERIKVYEDINRYSGNDKILFAQQLRDAVNEALQSGYSPFDSEQGAVRVVAERTAAAKKLQEAKAYEESWTILRASKFFFQAKEDKGVDLSTIRRYTTGLNYFKEWLNERQLLQVPVKDITASQVLAYLKEYSKREGWENKTYNNHLSNMQNFFNLLALGIHGIIPRNPIKGAEMRKTIAQKHAAYSDAQLNQILTQVRKRQDKYMEGLILTSYYACVRSKDEMRGLQVGNILFDRDLILLSADATKARREDYVPLDPILKQHYIDQGYATLPANWYIFGKGLAAGATKAHPNHYAELFVEYRKSLGISDRHTLYGFKHTRIIHLAKAGISPYALMQLCRWTSMDQMMHYLRDLGVIINAEAVANSKKI